MCTKGEQQGVFVIITMSEKAKTVAYILAKVFKIEIGTIILTTP